jgi:hypothetical protein
MESGASAGFCRRQLQTSTNQQVQRPKSQG